MKTNDRFVDVHLSAVGRACVNFEREHIDAGIQLGSGDWPGMNAQRLIPNELVRMVAPMHALKKPKQLEQQTLLHSLAGVDDWGLWLKAAGLSRLNARGRPI